MLAKLPVILSIWFLLSIVVTWLVAITLSAFREVPEPDFAPPLGTEADWQAVVKEVENVGQPEEVKDELLVLAR